MALKVYKDPSSCSLDHLVNRLKVHDQLFLKPVHEPLLPSGHSAEKSNPKPKKLGIALYGTLPLSKHPSAFNPEPQLSKPEILRHGAVDRCSTQAEANI